MTVMEGGGGSEGFDCDECGVVNKYKNIIKYSINSSLPSWLILAFCSHMIIVALTSPLQSSGRIGQRLHAVDDEKGWPRRRRRRRWRWSRRKVAPTAPLASNTHNDGGGGNANGRWLHGDG